MVSRSENASPAMHVCMHAQKDGHVENITSPAVYMMGGSGIEMNSHSAYKIF